MGNRRTDKTEQVLVRSLVTSHLGVTVLQSLGDYLTVGATRQSWFAAASAPATVACRSWDDGFDLAESLERGGSTKADVDVGAMLAVGALRVGLVVRNVTRADVSTRGAGEAS